MSLLGLPLSHQQLLWNGSRPVESNVSPANSWIQVPQISLWPFFSGVVSSGYHHTYAADYTNTLVFHMLSGTIRAPLKAWNPGLLTRHFTQNIAKSKLLCCPASLTPLVNLLAAAEGSLPSPHLLPPMELCCSLCLLWLNIACNKGSSIFAGFVFLWRCPWAIRLAQLLGRPHLLLQPGPPLQNLCSCSHSCQNREVLSGGRWHNASQHSSLTTAGFIPGKGSFLYLMNSSHATISTTTCWLTNPRRSTSCQSRLWPYGKMTQYS